MIDNELYITAEETVKALKQKGLTIATAESCTGGMVSAYITSVAGVSEVFEMGMTTYSCRIKCEALGVDNLILQRKGAISEETAALMAENIRKKAMADIGVAVTGAAGPDGSEGHPAGYVFIAVSGDKGNRVKLLEIEPKGRNFVRETAVKELFIFVQNYIKEI